MNLNVDHIVRSVAVVVVGLPLVLSLNNLVNVTANLAEKTGRDDEKTVILDGLKVKLIEPCVKYSVSKNDSKLEREAKTELDDILGGDVNHQSVCNWVM